jgi:hypothetical protein
MLLAITARHAHPSAGRPRLRVFRHRVALPPASDRRHVREVSLRLEPGHHPPATPSTAPPSREPLNELKPPAAFRIAVRRMQLRRPRPGPVGDLDPDSTVPGNDRDRDRLPGSTRAAMPDTITEDLADQQNGHIPARVPRTEYLRDEGAGGPRPLRQPGKSYALPDRHPGHHRTRPSLPAPARGKYPSRRAGTHGCTLDSVPRVKPGQPARAARPWPSVKQPTVHTDRHNCTRRPS